MPGNYSALGGYGMNPYDPRRDPREATGDGRPVMGTGGSSSGIGTAASFWAANVGTETSGSILSPANANMLVGIKPTVGRISRYGVIPITADQDTPGPMARTRGGRGHHAGRARGRRAGSERRGDEDLRAAAGPRLHEVPEPGRPQGRAHRHSAGVLLRSDDAAGRDPAAGRPERGAGEDDGRGHRDPQAAGRRHRRSGGHPERRRHRRVEELPALVHVRRPRQREGEGRRLLDRLQVRHEARLQRVAGVARRGGARQDADRAAAVERRAPARRAPSSTARRCWTSRTR